MPDEININPEEKIATINSYGNVTGDDIRKSIETTTKLFTEGTIKSVLVDATKQETLPDPFMLYELSDSFPFGLKMAVLIKKEQLTMEPLEFFEVTSYNKGKMLKLFDSVEAAKKWLYREGI